MTLSKQLTSDPSLISLVVLFLENQPRVSDSSGNSAQTICTPICEGKPTRLRSSPHERRCADARGRSRSAAYFPSSVSPETSQIQYSSSIPPLPESLQRSTIAAPLSPLGEMEANRSNPESPLVFRIPILYTYQSSLPRAVQGLKRCLLSSSDHCQFTNLKRRQTDQCRMSGSFTSDRLHHSISSTLCSSSSSSSSS